MSEQHAPGGTRIGDQHVHAVDLGSHGDDEARAVGLLGQVSGDGRDVGSREPRLQGLGHFGARICLARRDGERRHVRMEQAASTVSSCLSRRTDAPYAVATCRPGPRLPPVPRGGSLGSDMCVCGGSG